MAWLAGEVRPASTRRWPRRKEEEGRKSREEGMGSSVCFLSFAADIAAIRSVESPRGRALLEAGHF
jgi:hypothetical protein